MTKKQGAQIDLDVDTISLAQLRRASLGGVISAVLLLSSCAATPGSPATSSATAEASRDAGTSQGPCGLLAAAEVDRLLAEDGVEGRAATVAGLESCQWKSRKGAFVQVISTSAQEWAGSLPELLRVVESSGLFSDKENLRKLKEGAALVEAGGVVESDRACSLFSTMVEELQGLPEGSDQIVTVIPTREDPKGVTSQLCREGRYTSVMFADTAGLGETSSLGAELEALARTVSLRGKGKR